MMTEKKTNVGMLRWRAPLWPAVLLASMLALSACGGDKVQYGSNISGGNGANTQDPNGGGNTTPSRLDLLEPLNLQPGEALPGIHLRPGVEIIRLPPAVADQIMADDDAMTVTLTGEAKDAILEKDEVWTGDILIGDGFIYIIEGMSRGENDELIIEVSQFSLLDVIHGEWNIPFAPGSDLTEAGIRRQGLETTYAGPGSSVSFMDLIEGEASTTLRPRGGFSFPVEWDGAFEGKVSVAGTGINTGYNCESYTEERTRFILNPARLWAGDTYTVEVRPERFCVDYLRVKGSVGIEASMGYTLTNEGTLSLTPKKEINFLEGRAILGSTGLALYYEPYFEAGMEISVFGKTEHSLDASTGFTLPLGFEYKPRDFGFAMIPNERHPVQRTGELTASASYSEGARLKIYGQLGMKLALSDALSPQGLRLTGPEAGTELAVEAELKTAQASTDGNYEPCLTAELYARSFGQAALVGELKVGAWTWNANFTGTVGIEHKHVIASYVSEDMDFCWNDPVQPQELEVTLKWNTDTDLDLYLKTPNGNEIYYRNREADGGEFLGDSCIRGTCDGENNETIRWDNGDAPSGTYEVWAVNFDGKASASFTIEVRTEHGVIRSFSHTLPASEGAASSRYSFTIGTNTGSN
jgi:hypothetical protein